MATDDAVSTIFLSLKETDEQPRKQIAEIVEVLGAELALALLAETRRVQDEGGVEVRDGTRRRTDGGVFFALARGKLSKTDKNRIFRIRPPKPPEVPEEQRDAAPEKAGIPVETRRPRGASAAPREVAPLLPGLGRRRVVEVEVLRHHPKPAAPPPTETLVPAIPREVATREQEPAPRDARPLRRIFTVAPVTREEPPSTPDAARERVRGVLAGLSAVDRRRVAADVLREFGGNPDAGNKAPVPPLGVPEAARAAPPRGLDDATREKVLAAVTDALGLSSADLARALFGEETPGARAKARSALERWRKTARG